MDLSWGFLLPVWPPSNPSSQPTSHTSRGHMTSCTLTRLLEYSTFLFSSFSIILSSGFSSSLTPSLPPITSPPLTAQRRPAAWVRWWRMRSELCEKAFPQSSHL